MPFDALMLRALEQRWATELPGMYVEHIVSRNGLIWFKAKNRPRALLIALAPGLSRMHWTRHPVPKEGDRNNNQFFQRLTPFMITTLAVPPFERIVHLEILRHNDFEEPKPGRLIVEMAGHLTNLVLVTPDFTVVDAFRKIPPGRPGRTIWPGQPYVSPPTVANPCNTHDPNHLTPFAKRLYSESEHWSWESFCSDWNQANYHIYHLTSPQGEADLWVYPLEGYQSVAVTDPDAALDEYFRSREQAMAIEAQRKQLARLLEKRRQHLEQKITDYQSQMAADPNQLRHLGDLWLTYQYLFQNRSLPCSVEVPSLENPATMVVLTAHPGDTPVALAQAYYREARKQQARKTSLAQILPQLAQELAEVSKNQAILADTVVGQAWLAHQLQITQKMGAKPVAEEVLPYRRFQTQSGYPILVGRSQQENADLTFRRARPDDMWFHVKQSPGSHVILGCGKSHPNLDDLLDAAELAVFYSQASQSSMVPVDYTRRKFVRKRPHGDAGQVLYRQEKTLYITPDPNRLRRLGAVKEKLAARGNPGSR